MTLSKSDARRLAHTGMEKGAHVLRGVLTIDENGARINGRDISEWLEEYVDREVVIIAAPVGGRVRDNEVKSCPRCGRDYRGDTCPRCAQARARLRG